MGYYIGGIPQPHVPITGDARVKVVQGSTISGIICEVRGMALPQGPYYPIVGATITLIKNAVVVATTTSNGQGNYTIVAPEARGYTVHASKTGYRDRDQQISITALGQTYTLNCKGKQGLIPNAPNIWYLLDCAALWKYTPADLECKLDIWDLLDVAAAWKYPIVIHTGLDINSTIGQLWDNLDTHALVAKWIPGFFDNPQATLARGMTFGQVQPLSGGAITIEMVDGLAADLLAIK